MQNYCSKCNQPLEFIVCIEDPEEKNFKYLFYCSRCENYNFIVANMSENN